MKFLEIIYNTKYLIDNCGNFSTEYYYQKEGDEYFKNATAKEAESYRFQQVENLDNINHCKQWKGDNLPDYLIKEKLKDRAKFYESNKIFFLKDSF